MSLTDRIMIGGLALAFAGAAGVMWWQAGLSQGQAVIVGAVLFVVLYLLISGRLLAGVLYRVFLALLPFLVMAAAVVWYIVLPSNVPPSTQPALIAGTVIATGWLATFVANEYQRARQRDTTQQDVLLALRSEVFTIVEKLDKNAITDGAAKVQERIREAGDKAPGAAVDPAYYPFSASESPATVYQSVSGSISVLEADTLEPVLRFYAAFSELTAMVEDTRSEPFRALVAERRIRMHKELTAHRKATLYWGLRAIATINEELGVERPRNIPRSGKNQDVAL